MFICYQDQQKLGTYRFNVFRYFHLVYDLRDPQYSNDLEHVKEFDLLCVWRQLAERQR
jgi:hypothetical protein